MFEKEAEEYADNQIGCGDGYYEWTDVTQAYQKGAEFGYNKAKKEFANEWHYVKNGDYPKDNKSVLCILGDVDSNNYEVGHYNDVGSCEHWYFESFRLPDDDGDNAWGVSAWKEIVLPELKESE